MNLPPRKRKTSAGSLRQIARRMGIPYRHTKPTDDGSRAEEALVEFLETGGTRLEDLKAALATPTETEGGKALAALDEWIRVWDRICDEADPDEGPLPDWKNVRLAMMPEFDPLQFPTAEFFSSYMKADLIYRVRDLLSATPLPGRGR